MIRHVLLDADGVLQDRPGTWSGALVPFLGARAAEFLDEVVAAEQPALRGHGDFRDVLADQLHRYGVDHDVDDVMVQVWEAIEVADATPGLVDGLRELGLGVHLASNQTARRAAYMRSELGYDDLVDESFYSCDLGAAKPEAAFFAAAVERLGTTPPRVLFVDDSERNVQGAREVGLAAEHWHLDDGMPRLHGLLAGHGLVL